MKRGKSQKNKKTQVIVKRNGNYRALGNDYVKVESVQVYFHSFNMMGESEIILVILIIITGDTVHYAKLDV